MKVISIAAPALIAAAAASADDSIARPDFSPLAVDDAPFFEQFHDGYESRWKVSHAQKEGEQELSYVGKWAFEEPTVLPAFNGDKGLVVKSAAARHAISSKFNTPIDNTDKTLVVQYEVKAQQGLNCGGAYLKLLSEHDTLYDDEFNGDTPYQLMFGPDKCGATNKVHLILRRKNPLNDEYEEKHLKLPPKAKVSKFTSLYTLILKQNQDFEIRIDGKVEIAGNLLEDGVFQPSFNPPKEIDDENDTKPDDWIDDAKIPDPEQLIKPDDWDEDAPFEIIDPEAIKPEDWDENALEYIPDPESEIPEDWDEEEDGEWIAPEIYNPECEEHGCGKWIAPTIKNPNYKGKFQPPLIDNPDYLGVWKPRKIPNPNYFDDTNPSNLEPIGAIGFELWTMQPDILFDNIYIGHSIDQAELIGNETFVPKLKLEKSFEEKDDDLNDDDEDAINGGDSLIERSKQVTYQFIDDAAYYWSVFSKDPVNTVKEDPGLFFKYGGVFGVIFSIVFSFWSVLFFIIGKVFSKTPDVPAPAPSAKDSTDTIKKQPKIEEIKDESITSSSVSAETETTKRNVEVK